ncbi:MAG: hypothetical protein CSA24_01960 [Deltaproteobacteria bacterium]|nr:MAG: hypothetical protein CSB49_08180 [Pseudomonadota bacterium]PIE65797.1 MAG: hypothetical protein CSA24_01960 [Deltaproteobacteria bacterium]
MESRPLTRALIGALLFVLLLPPLVLVEGRLAALSEPPQKKMAPAQTFFLPPPSVVRTLSFGYNELAADLIWVRCIAYFADHLVTDRDVRHIHRYVETVVALDPYLKTTYRYGAAMLTAIPSGNASIHRAIALLERGHAIFPEDHMIPLRIGIHYLQELKTTSSRERRAWRLMGAGWIHRAILLGAEQPWLASLAAQVYSKEGKRQMAIHSLQELFAVTQDPATRKQIGFKLRQLKLKSLRNRLRSQAKRFADAQREAKLTFVSGDLYALIELPAATAFSLASPTASSPALPR